MAKTLASFAISGAGDEYVLHLEDEDGETVEYTASFEVLDLMMEAIDERLNSDEEDMLEVDDDEVEDDE